MLKLFKLLGNKRLFILLMGLILFIAVMGFTLGPRTSLSWPEKFVKDTVGFVQYVFYKPASYIAGLFEDIANLRALQEENEQLKIALAHYTRDKATYNWIDQENKRLQKELDFTNAQKELYNYDWKIAHVISVNDDPVNNTIVLDIGAREGVKEGMAVHSDQGLVGVISRVSNFTSTVRLATSMDAKDPNSNGIAVTAQGKENDVFGMIETYDKEKGMFLMTRIEDGTPLKKGDLIVSSGVGGAFPRGMIIGTVKDIQVGEYGLTYTATVKPAASFTDWKELFVVFTPEMPEMPEGEGSE
ncbi:MAG: rod shape-determining protein MreC [Paenibacillus macerans]|uniref:Cell shape-determining protein MreC n=1 Tax=Paenibacillus macerans TaxID=44252 RepID=A0A090ZIF7_PAEMA|nr:rod shape-determining protein MreC [Paenibacillus macerans]KFN11099.1 rod shape-determining protein MreC [Paenibacillus macerans]MBS5914072.1 rod shape-determining protein MreC [Paenibacillus macerans]MCY7562724.1 rod shape-determining protein MreC [Paenibacillus macerans]MDU5947060.1 rod shape-determining protein MreC [Paenibacillus macerans]MDU7476449.1 rod shape-determining protein MreC [Paenibacillus macerans]